MNLKFERKSTRKLENESTDRCCKGMDAGAICGAVRQLRSANASYGTDAGRFSLVDRLFA